MQIGHHSEHQEPSAHLPVHPGHHQWTARGRVEPEHTLEFFQDTVITEHEAFDRHEKVAYEPSPHVVANDHHEVEGEALSQGSVEGEAAISERNAETHTSERRNPVSLPILHNEHSQSSVNAHEHNSHHFIEEEADQLAAEADLEAGHDEEPATSGESSTSVSYLRSEFELELGNNDMLLEEVILEQQELRETILLGEEARLEQLEAAEAEAELMEAFIVGGGTSETQESHTGHHHARKHHSEHHEGIVLNAEEIAHIYRELWNEIAEMVFHEHGHVHEEPEDGSGEDSQEQDSEGEEAAESIFDKVKSSQGSKADRKCKSSASPGGDRRYEPSWKYKLMMPRGSYIRSSPVAAIQDPLSRVPSSRVNPYEKWREWHWRW